MSRPTPDPVVAAAANVALTKAATAARRYLLSPLAFLRSVGSVEHFVRGYHRALFIVERRTAILCFGPATAGGKPVPSPNPDRVDPWSGTPAQIAEASRVTVACSDCKGSGDVPCPELRQKKHTACVGCAGTGRVAGARGDRQCLRCRGTGMLGCRTCQAGSVPCLKCSASGRRAAWIEIRTEKHLQVTAERAHPVARTNPRLMQASDFENGPWPHRLLSDERCQGLPPSCPPELRPKINPQTERVLWTRVQVFGQGALRLSYASALSQGMLVFDENGSGPLPGSSWQPLVWRKRLILGATGLVALLATIVSWRFSTQNAWFANYAHGGWVLLLGILAVPFIGAVASEVLLPKHLRRSRRVLVPALLVGALWSAIGLITTFERPSSERAEAALRQGDLERAKIEAEALHEGQQAPAASTKLLDDVHSRRFAAAANLAERVEIASTTWFSPELKVHAWNSIQSEGEQLLQKSVAARDVRQLTAIKQLTHEHLPELSQRAAQQAAILRTENCVQSQDEECVVREAKAAVTEGLPPSTASSIRLMAQTALQDQLAARLRDLRSAKRPLERQELLTHALKAAEQLVALTGEEPRPTRAQLSLQLKKVTASVEREAVKQALRKTEQPLLCCDGTRSSSCRCGKSARGCCSRHGGVCGGCE